MSYLPLEKNYKGKKLKVENIKKGYITTNEEHLISNGDFSVEFWNIKHNL